MDEFLASIFPDPTLGLIVTAVYLGLVIGIACSLVVRTATHRLIARLIREKADSHDSAKTLAELGCDTAMCRRLVRPSAPVMKYLRVANGAEAVSVQSGFAAAYHRRFLGDGAKHLIDVKTARLYLPEDKRIGAELRFSEEKHPVLTFVLAVVVLAAVGVGALYLIPQFESAYGSIFS